MNPCPLLQGAIDDACFESVCLFVAHRTGVSVPQTEAWLIASVLELRKKRGLHVKWVLKTSLSLSLSLSFVFPVFRGSPDRDGGVSTS